MTLGVRPRVTGSAVLFLAVACGGAAHESKTAETSPAPEVGAAHETNDAPTKSAEPEPPKPHCDDGSCFACGTGVCPTGFYCDDGAPGGAACSWVPACAKGTSCECLSHALGSAPCTTTGGGPHVGG